MDNPLQRRLLGVVVIMGCALIALWLLPSEHAPDEKGTRSVTVPLNGQSPDTAAAGTTAATAPPASGSVATLPREAPATAGAVVATRSESGPEPDAPAASEAAAAPPSASAPAHEPPPATVAKPVPEPAAKPSPPPSFKPTRAAPAERPAERADHHSAKAAGEPVAPPAPTHAAAPKPMQHPAPPPAAKATPASAGKQVWYVQVGSFSGEGNAQTTATLLRNAGYRVQVSPVTTAAGVLQRVRIGPFDTEEQADAVLAKVHHQGYPHAGKAAE
jgi:DedD protein